MLTSRSASEPGRYRSSRTPCLREIMNDLAVTSTVQIVVLKKAAQIGASEAGNCWVGYVVDQAPGPMMLVQPTVELATGPRGIARAGGLIARPSGWRSGRRLPSWWASAHGRRRRAVTGAGTSYPGTHGSGAPGFFITTWPDRSRCSTRRSAVILAIAMWACLDTSVRLAEALNRLQRIERFHAAVMEDSSRCGSAVASRSGAQARAWR